MLGIILSFQDLIKKQNYFFFTKTMYNGTVIELKCEYTFYLQSLSVFMKSSNASVAVSGLSETCTPSVKLNIAWYLRSSPCHDEVFGLDVSPLFICHFM